MRFIKYQLYLLQIENYEIDRFFRLLFRKGYFGPSATLRKKLVWTKKIYLILLISLLLILLSSYLAMNLVWWLAIVWILFSLAIMPLYYAISLYLIYPFDIGAKKRLMARAKALVASKPELKIIGIAGSYGKTTMKNVLSAVLSKRYNVLMPDGNTNTTVGLSAWILKKGVAGSQVLLIEFGEEYPGDNRRIASIFPQDLIVITGINEAHLERMGSIDKTAKTIFEATSSAKQSAEVYLDVSDHNVKKYYPEYIGNLSPIDYTATEAGEVKIDEKQFDPESLSWSAKVSDLDKITVSCLAEYILSDIAVAVSIAKNSLFKLSNEEIKAGLRSIRPVEHRLQPIKNELSGVLVIDDSYNGNPDGVAEAIKTLGLFQGRRKIYLTPGLVETGDQNREVHISIGAQLAKIADKVILIKNSATPYIAEGLRSAGFSDANIIWFESASEAHNSLGSILQKNDVILFQNDWGDQYL